MSDTNSKRFYSRIAKQYHFISRKLFNKYHTHVLKKVLEENPNLNSLADIGAGPGDFLKYLHDQKPEVRLFAQDIAEPMIAILKEQLPEAQTIVGPAEKIEFEDNAFDIVTNMYSLHHYTNAQKSFDEMARILKPSGKLYYLDVCPNKFLRPIFNALGCTVGDGHAYFFTTEEIKEMLEKSGLKVLYKEKLNTPRQHFLTVAEKI